MLHLCSLVRYGFPQGMISAHVLANVQVADRRHLRGTSTLAYESERPEHCPAVATEAFMEVVVPFFSQHPSLIGSRSKAGLASLYRWAVGAVSAYSFELGDEKLTVCSLADTELPDIGACCVSRSGVGA